MDVFEQLALLLEIAVTQLGFIAVFFILSGGTGRFSPDDAHFVHAMVLSASFVIIVSIGPRATIGVAEGADVWRIWSVVGTAAAALIGVVVAWKQAHLAFEEAGGLSAWWHVPGWTLGLCGAAGFTAGAFGVEPIDGYYLAGASLFLLNAIWCFVAVVFRKCL